MLVVVRIYIVRHGETDANRAGILQGQMDTQLNEAGIAQAGKTAEALEKVPFHFAYASDLSRAAKTADIILSKHPGVSLTRDEELRERSFGDIEGQRVSVNGRMDVPANAETPGAFSRRVIQWWNRVIGQRRVQATRTSQAQGQDGSSADANAGGALADSLPSSQANTRINILVVSHGGAIGALMEALLGSRKYRCAQGVIVSRCKNASISVIELGGSEDGQGVLVSFGDTTHLDGGLVEVNVDEVADGGGSDEQASVMRRMSGAPTSSSGRRV